MNSNNLFILPDTHRVVVRIEQSKSWGITTTLPLKLAPCEQIQTIVVTHIDQCHFMSIELKHHSTLPSLMPGWDRAFTNCIAMVRKMPITAGQMDN